jgi:uncharacterized protein (TIGR00251 family)
MLRESEGRVFLDVRVTPSASKNEIAGTSADGRLRVKIAAPPTDGKANTALRAFMADLAACAKREVLITAGEKSRLKTLSFPAACRARLSAYSG